MPKKLTDPNLPLRLWIPATMLTRVHPALVEQFLDGQGKKKCNRKSRATPFHDPNDFAEDNSRPFGSVRPFS